MPLAIFKYISSKNADYSTAEKYMTFEHDEFTMKATTTSFKRLADEIRLAVDAHQWIESIQEYWDITELDAATLNRLIKEIVVHETIDSDKTRHISIKIS